LVPPFINCVFYACLLAVRRASARQAALPYLVGTHGLLLICVERQHSYHMLIDSFLDSILSSPCTISFVYFYDLLPCHYSAYIQSDLSKS
jgi:hypothetical protein